MFELTAKVIVLWNDEPFMKAVSAWVNVDVDQMVARGHPTSLLVREFVLVGDSDGLDQPGILSDVQDYLRGGGLDTKQIPACEFIGLPDKVMVDVLDIDEADDVEDDDVPSSSWGTSPGYSEASGVWD